VTEDPRREEGIRARGEEALSDLAQALLDNPIFGQAVSTAIGAGERAAHAQRSAMGALNIPAATDFERLEQRMRSLSTRLEAVEDQLDDALDELAALRRKVAATDSGDAAQGAGAPEAFEA
jgi:chromosome segregation ATPase